MKTTLSSRERMFLAINHQEADHVPLIFQIFGGWTPPYDGWDSELDHTLSISAPSCYHPDVNIRTWREVKQDERYPLLLKEYETPRGVIRQIAQQTEDWPHGDDVPLVSDHLVSRGREFAVKDAADLEKIPYLFFHPSDEQVRDFREHAKSVKHRAQELQVVVTGAAGGFGDYAAWLMGITNLMSAMIYRPAFVHQLLDTILEWEIRSTEFLLDSGVVDIVIHRGWYECSDFWPPDLYCQFIAPRLAKKIQLAHQAGKKFGYIMSTGIMPLLDIFLELDLDILIHVDPVQGGADLRCLKEKTGERICFWGGVNSAVTLGSGSRDEIRDAVTLAISTLAPEGGHILSAADTLWQEPWENVKTMIERWREISSYPIEI